MDFGDLLYCVIIIIPMIIAGSIFHSQKRAGVSLCPTMPTVRRVVIDRLKHHTNKDKPLYIGELGSGCGGLAIKIAKSLPHAVITGFEISPFPLFLSRLMTMFNHRVIILNEDFFEHDLMQFNALVCYLSPNHMKDLEDKLKNVNNKPLIISCSFRMPNTVPDEIITIKNFININVYVYHSRR